MKKLLHHFKKIHFLLLLLVLSGNVNGQTYTITGTVNAGALSCSTFLGNSMISIGNGSTATTLIMNVDLDLTSCSLGPIQLIINNATLDFSTANKRLYLPEGSSISFINGGILNPPGGNGGGCTGNDRVYIGGVLLATCQGGAGLLGFDELITLGGTGRVASNSPVCDGNSINLFATPPQNGGPYIYSWSGPNSFSSTSQNPALTATATSAGVYLVTMTSTTLSSNISINVQTTVVVNSLVNNVTNGFRSSSFCAGDQATMTFDANNGSGVYPYTIEYKNNTTNATASVTIANDNTTTFNIIPNPTSTTSYTLLSITDANGCMRTTGFVDFSASATITALPASPTIGTITQPSCSVTNGSVVLSGLPASGTWTLTRSGTSSATTTGTGTTTTISGLATGTYTYTVSNGTCTSLASANVVINAQPQTPSTPTISSYTMPTFADNDGTITLDNLPAGAWVGNQIKDGVTTTISGTGSPYTLTSLSYGSYQFEVVGVCVSPTSIATTLTTVPYTPAVSAATAINCTGFNANWPATPTATAYLLDVSTVSNFATFVPGYQDRNVGNVLTYSVTGMPGGTLYYRIRAKNATQISLYSATITVVTPTALSVVTVTPNGAQTICLTDTGSLLTVAETGGGTIAGRQWGKRSSSGGAITAIGGQTGATFSPTGAGLAAGTWYVVCTSTPTCGSVMVSNEVMVTVNPASVGGILSGANTDVCSGIYNSNVLLLSGHTGNIIRWESSTDNFATAGTPISNTGNTQVIGSHLTTTYYRAVVQSGVCSIAYSSVAKITVYAAMSSPGGISVNGGTAYPPSGAGISHCANTSTVFSIAPVANATSYTWLIPSGWTLISGQGSQSVTVITGNNSDSSNISVYANNPGCSTNSSFLYLYLNPSTEPTTALIQPTCAVPTGTVTVTSPVPAAGITYTLVGTNPLVSAVTNTTGVFSGLSTGAYDVTVKNGTFVSVSGITQDPLTNCASTTSATINSLVTNTWTGAWNNGTPNSDQNLVFNADFPSPSNIDGCTCTVNSGNVNFNFGYTLKITNWVHVNGGSLTFDDGASLVQINNVSNINLGNIKYKRQTTKITKMDYTYWSTPVMPFTLGGVSPNTMSDKMYSYDSNLDNWKQESPSTSMVAGVGYIIRGPQNYVAPMPPSTYEATFIGVPNNGHYQINGVIANRSYLLGNPYPSALDADTFLDANQNVLDGTLYFWTHNTPIAIGTPNPGTGLYAYSGNDYASYNRTGGVGTAAPSGISGLNNDNIPTGKIASGQGFFGASKTSITDTKIVYDNAMRVGVGGISGDNSMFFRTKKQASIEKNRVWLNLTNIEGAFKQTLIGYITGATNDNEGQFDGETFDGNDFIDMYSINQGKKLTIQGRSVPFDVNDVIPLGYRVAVGGTFTINIGKTDGELTNQAVYLEDKLTQKTINLKQGNYTFTTAKGTFDNRFVLRYANKTLGVKEETANDGIIVLYSNVYKGLIIRNNTKDAFVKTVSLYNLEGKHIAQWEVNEQEQTNIQIPIKNLSSEIYIVKIKTDKGESSKKIIIK